MPYTPPTPQTLADLVVRRSQRQDCSPPAPRRCPTPPAPPRHRQSLWRLRRRQHPRGVPRSTKVCPAPLLSLSCLDKIRLPRPNLYGSDREFYKNVLHIHRHDIDSSKHNKQKGTKINLFSTLLIKKTSTCAALMVKSTIRCKSLSHDIVMRVLLLFGRKYFSDMSVTSTWNTLDTSSLKLSSGISRVTSTACASPPLYIKLPLGPDVNSPPYWQIATTIPSSTMVP
jgi:hypothetical protein